MDTVLATVDFMSNNTTTILAIVFGLLTCLTQLAALFNIEWLAKYSQTAHDVIQKLAGNWGYAMNAAEVVRTYETGGPIAALNALATLNVAQKPPPS